MVKIKSNKRRAVEFVALEWLNKMEATVSANTWKSYNSCVNHFITFFGGADIKSIKLKDLQMLLDGYAEVHARSSVKTYHTVIRSVFAFAKLKGVRVVSTSDLIVPKDCGHETRKRDALSKDQEERVDAYQKEVGAGTGALTIGYFLMYTGCRMGEALALTYEDIDWNVGKYGAININKTLSYTFEVPTLENRTKSANGIRGIPVLESLAPYLDRNGAGLLFPNKYGGYMHRTQFYTFWRNYKAYAGLEDYVTPHCMRHTFATICYECGFKSRDTAYIMGDDVATVERIYTHLRGNVKNDILNTFAEIAARYGR